MAYLEIKGVSKSYGPAQILKDINLEIERGEAVALIGPTGSGKTTLLRLINLLEKPDRGRIIFDHQEVGDASERERLEARRKMAMVFQKPVMFSASVRENVSYGLKIRGIKSGDKVKEALRRVNLLGYEERDATTLSGGEMQRIALARVLVLESELLLLDEPTANLDPKTADSIDKLIEDLSRKNTTIIMATHNMLQARKLADRVAVLLGGRLIALGRPDEVFGSKALFSPEVLSAMNAPW